MFAAEPPAGRRGRRRKGEGELEKGGRPPRQVCSISQSHLGLPTKRSPDCLSALPLPPIEKRE